MKSQAAPADALPASWVAHMPPRLRPWLQLMRLDRPVGTWLLFWPCVMGLLLGAAAEERRFLEWRDYYYVILFGVGALVMRGAGCAFNDIIDRNIDAQVARTRGRPIPSGAISPKQALTLLAGLCLIGLVILLQFNWFAVVLGAASLLLVAAYPFMKRITWWPQAWLGLTFNWGALLGFAAQTGRLDLGGGHAGGGRPDDARLRGDGAEGTGTDQRADSRGAGSGQGSWQGPGRGSWIPAGVRA